MYGLSIICIGPADYTHGSLVVLIPAGAVKATLPVPTQRDNIVEDNEHFKVTLSLAIGAGNVIIGSPHMAFVTITDATGMWLIWLMRI